VDTDLANGDLLTNEVEIDLNVLCTLVLDDGRSHGHGAEGVA
jgi:hypothetical protein